VKISLLCPTRGRPKGMGRLVQSLKDTIFDKSGVELIFYIDSDDAGSIKKFDKLCSYGGFSIRCIVGHRIIRSMMWNECYEISSREICMVCADDLVFETNKWDKMVRAEFEAVPDRILLLHGWDGIKNENRATHGFIHRNWVETVGCFVAPYFSFWYNDTWLTEVADRIERRKYNPKLRIRHKHCCLTAEGLDNTYKEAKARGLKERVHEIWRDTAKERVEDARKLQEFINAWKEGSINSPT